MPEYRNRPVFEFPVDWSRNPNARFEFDLRELQVGFGRPEFAPLQTDVIHGWRFRIVLQTPGERAALDAFLSGVQGRRQGFWFPAPEKAFEITAGVNTTRFDIAGQGLATTWAEHPAHHLYFTKDGQSAQAAELTAVSVNPEGTERVTVTPAVGLLDSGWTARWLYYVRMTDDIERATVIAEGVEERELRVVELVAEYAAAETGSEPVYLYHFWADFGGTIRHWRYTSGQADVNSALGDFMAAPVSHGTLRLSTRAEAEELTLEAAYDAGNPLALLFPNRLAVPLWVEVLETTASNPDVATLLFSGLVLSTSVQGRKQTVRCGSAMDALRGGVPGMVIQPRCNYRLFEPGTCGLDRSTYAVPVALDSREGRLVVVSGAGLVGRGANWFAEGWLETGTGDQLEVRTVLASTLEAGSKVILTLNSALAFAPAGALGMVYPGCDGRDVTCSNKFGNFQSWGGHRVPLRNLSLKALEISAGSGGKK